MANFLTTRFLRSNFLTTKIAFSFVAASITVSLFMLMSYLITPTGDPPDKESEDIAVVITREEREENNRDEQRKPPPKPREQQEPPPPPIARTKPKNLNTEGGISADLPNWDESTNGTAFNPGNQRATPIVRIPPEYPHQAITRNIEGWVMVEFTITIAGTVEDVRVIESEPSSIFDRESIRAIKRWKYQPKMENGQPVPQFNMREVIRFQIATNN